MHNKFLGQLILQMNGLMYSLIWAITLFILVLPFIIVTVLRILLRQYGFRASVGGPKTFTRICLKYQVKMNLQMLINIESIQLKFNIPTTFSDIFADKERIAIIIHGLQINLLLKDDFKTWGTQKIELLQIINQMREKLTRLGILKTHMRQLIDEQNSQQQQQQQIKKVNRTVAYRNVFLSVLVKLFDTQCNFFVFKLDQQDKDLDLSNLREFNTLLSNKQFQENFLCARLQAPSATVQIKKIQEEDLDLVIKMDKLLLQNPKQLHKCGLLNQVEIFLKIPLNAKLVKDFCNFELRVQVHDGILNLNKRFLQSFLNFFVYFDALLTVIKGIRKLVLKQHFQDSLMYELMKQHRKGAQTIPIFANYKDSAIPKRLQIIICDGLHIMVSDESKQLKQILKAQDQQSLLFYGKLQKRTIFELTSTLKDSYYLNFNCEKIDIDVNNESAVRATNFVQELDLTFLREVTQLPIKMSRMFLEQRLDFQSLNLDMTPSLFKVLHEIVNFYHKSKSIASVKHIILGWLFDRNFLLTNIIATSNNTEIRLSDEQILEIYEQQKHQDKISTQVCIQNLNVRGLCNSVVQSNKLKLQYIIENGTITQGLECTKMQIYSTSNNLLPLFKTVNFRYQKYVILPTSPLNKSLMPNRNEYIKTSALKFQLTINLEELLSNTDEIITYAIIKRCFTRKWSTKYSLNSLMQEAYKNSITQSNLKVKQVSTITKINAVYFEEAVIAWYMSSQRIMCLTLTHFRPQTDPQSAYQEQLGKELIDLIATKAYQRMPMFKDAQGTLIIEQTASSGQLIHQYQDHNQDQLIVDSQNLSYLQQSSSQHQDFRVCFGYTNANLPYDYHFGSFINECIKQVSHTFQWFRIQYKQAKQNANFQYKIKKVQIQLQPKQVRTMNLSLEFAGGKLNFDDNPLKHTFVIKNDIADTIAQRELVKLKTKSVYNLIKKMKAARIYQKYLTVELQQFRIFWSKPLEFQKFNNCFDRISQLDEADQYLNRAIFSEIRGSNYQVTANYMVWHCRSFVKPLLELWGYEFNIQALFGVMNPINNPQFFIAQIQQKIFNKFAIPSTFNRMVNKMYYDGSLTIQKLTCAVQGHQTFLFLNDLGSFFERLISFVDISKSKDRLKEFLPYYQGLDRFRNKYHGKFQVKVPKSFIEIWPKRMINRYTNKLMVELFDIEYEQKTLLEKDRKQRAGHPALLQHLLCLRGLTVTKDPIKQFESALINLPLVELQLYTNYNRGQTLNHYLHQQTHNLQSYLEQLKAYVTRDFYIEIKLNLPSFGSKNQTKKKSLFLPQFMQSYISNSPVPIINYQRSYLQLLDEVLREYINGGKRDVSNRILRKINAQKNNQNVVKYEQWPEFQIKCHAFFSDILILFTDFDESEETFGDQNLDNQILEPEEIENDFKRDQYLARYQGLMFSVSNACLQTLTEVTKGVERRNFRSLSSYYKSNFMRLAAINSSNLFNIRNSSVEVNQPGSMDNYRIFLSFFEIDRSTVNNIQDQEKLLNGFKTLFPNYVLQNENIQHSISEAQGLYQTAQECLQESNSSLPLFTDQGDLSIEEYFQFKEDDTIAIISRTSYSQNKAIKWAENSFENLSREMADQPPIQINEVQGVNSDEIIVRHCLEFEKVRLLYTNKIQEIFVHFLIRGFDFRHLRKTQYADLLKRNSAQPARDFLREYKQSESMAKHQQPKAKLKYQLEKEAFFALILKDPQISCQNSLSKSQLLFALESTTTAVIHAYSVKSQAFKRNDDHYFDMIAMTNLMVDDVVKYELSISVKNMDCYVAPTYVKDQYYTFWANSCIKSFELSNGDCDLRRILQIEDTNLKIQLLNDSLVDYNNPQWAVDLILQKLSCEMDGPALWHAYGVFQIILLSRGEKSTELVFIEEAKLRDLASLKLNQLRDMIDQELKQSQFFLGDNVRPDLSRRLEYSFKTVEFTLYNNNKKFSSGLVENISGKHRIFINRESNQDIDVDRITLQNHIDTDEYRMVLYPSNFAPRAGMQQNVSDQQERPTTMIKLRARDKFVVVKEAPWRVYDQIEIFIHPTSIQLTQQFYSQLKIFFFQNNPLKKNNAKKSYSFLTAGRVFQKQIVRMQAKKDSQITVIPLSEREMSHELMMISQSEISNQSSEVPRPSTINLSDSFQSQTQIIETQKDKDVPQEAFPSFFRYMRINEIKVQISYYHAQHHLLNIRDYKLKLPPYISHGAFTTFRKALESYEAHSRRNFISQIPNLLMRKAAQVKEKVKDMKADDLVEEQFTAATKQEMKLAYARKVIHGDYAL